MKLKDLAEIILSYEKIIIAGHVNPDGDAVGSCLALGLFLKSKGKDVFVLLEEYNERYNILNGAELVYKGELKDLKPQIFIALDSGDKKRLGAFAKVFDNAEKTVVIDHHISNDNYGDYNYVDCTASATCEIIYKIISEMGGLDKAMAENLYAGLITDTGGLRHKNTTADTFEIASSLIKKDINFTEIYSEVFFAKSLTEHLIFTKVISDIEFLKDYPIAYAFASREMLLETGSTQKDLDGIVEYINNIRGVCVAVFAYELEDGIKLSMRSKSLDVSRVAKKIGGGGHVNAAGASVKATLECALDKVINIIKSEMDENGY